MVLGYTVWSWNHLEPLMKPEAWDLEAFARINQFTAPGWLDKGAVLFRTASTWIPLYLLVLIWLLRSRPPGWQILILGLLCSVVLSDQISASWIKPWVQRLRPCRYDVTAENCRLLVPCGTGYSFPSSHASNHFALAWTLGLWMLRRGIPWPLGLGSLWALGIALAQVRVGLHFPSDVVAGALLGVLVAYTVHQILTLLDTNRKPKERAVL